MILESLYKYGLNIDTFHSFAFFLGTDTGELLKRLIELIFFSIIIYMLISEFKVNRKREYKYLIVGFFALFVRQVVISIILFSKVFSTNKFLRFETVITLMDGYLETIALLLLVSAFIFPIYKEKTLLFQKRMVYVLFLITTITFFTYILFKSGMLPDKYTIAIPEAIQILILASPFYMITKAGYKKIKYKKSILIAFFIYLLIPLINFISYLIVGSVDPRLVIVEHPLPFISILLIMRTVYLTLVDKAFLRTKLKKSEDIVKHERDMGRLKDHFISFVGHELKTPITSIKLYLSLLSAGKFGKILPKQKKAILTLSNENNRLSDLINDLLIMNKIEAEKLRLDKSKFKLSEIIDNMYIDNAKAKGINVVNKIKTLTVFGDKDRLKQVYINLMNNATKFSNKGGLITLNAGTKNKNWWLSIKDTGIGIHNDEIPKMFDKFYQIEDILTRKNPGIGLGLSIVKNIIQLHNGKIDVKSEIGKGTEIKITIPNKL